MENAHVQNTFSELAVLAHFHQLWICAGFVSQLARLAILRFAALQ
jgi:hypothetical protein